MSPIGNDLPRSGEILLLPLLGNTRTEKTKKRADSAMLMKSALSALPFILTGDFRSNLAAATQQMPARRRAPKG